MIELHRESALTQGSGRCLFQHPHDSESLIKINLPEYDQKMFRKRFRRLRYFLYLGQAGNFAEVSEYMRLLGRTGRLPSYIAAYKGFCQTNLGVGLVVQKIQHQNQLASTLRIALEQRRVTVDQALDLLRQLEHLLQRDHAIVSDIALENVVVDFVGSPRLVVVDGLGDNTLIPVRQFLPWVYAVWLRQKFSEMRRHVENRYRCA